LKGALNAIYAIFGVISNNIFLLLAVSLENQIYLSQDLPLREHDEQRDTIISNSVEMFYITGKACEEHTACEGKAFGE